MIDLVIDIYYTLEAFGGRLGSSQQGMIAKQSNESEKRDRISGV
jgi:hypothetical protein